MFTRAKNGFISINRGDTATFNFYINLGSGVNPNYYTLKAYDKDGNLTLKRRNEVDESGDEDYIVTEDFLYFAILEPGQKWEDAIVKKVITVDWLNPHDEKAYKDGELLPVLIHIYSEDTEYLKPGTYYYQVKLLRCELSTADHFEHVDTVQPRTKFIVLE